MTYFPTRYCHVCEVAIAAATCWNCGEPTEKDPPRSWSQSRRFGDFSRELVAAGVPNTRVFPRREPYEEGVYGAE